MELRRRQIQNNHSDSEKLANKGGIKMTWLRPCDKHYKEGFTTVLKGNFCYDCDQRNEVIKEE